MAPTDMTNLISPNPKTSFCTKSETYPYKKIKGVR